MKRKIISRVLDVFKFLLAGYMMLAGILTVLADPLPDSDLGIVYETKATLVVLGLIIFGSGLALFIGKAFRKRRLHGQGLFAIYNCFLFAGILNWVGLGWSEAWPNFIGAVIVGLLYLRWKYHIYYYEPSVDTVRSRMLESDTDGWN